jgi:hypothetical protein
MPEADGLLQACFTAWVIESLNQNGTMRPVRRCDPSPFCKRFPVSSLEWDYVYGLESDIPLCCILEFCYRRHVLKQERIALRALGVSDKTVITKEHYRMLAADGLDFVPCTFHRLQIAAAQAARAARRSYEHRFKY